MLPSPIARSQNHVVLCSAKAALLRLITLLALGIAATCQLDLASADDNSSEKLPVWSVTPTAGALLADRVDGEWFSIQPPKGFERADLGDTEAFNKAGIKVAVWTHVTDQEMNPTITIMELPTPNSENQGDQKFVKGMLDSLKARWPNAEATPLKHGQWNGGRALRFEFSATTNSGAAIDGIAIAIVGDFPTFVVSAMQIKDTAADAQSLTALTDSVISCTKK